MSAAPPAARRLRTRDLAHVPVLDLFASAPPGSSVGATWVVSVPGDTHDPVRGALWRLCTRRSIDLPVVGTSATAGPSALKAFSDAEAALAALPWGWSALPSIDLSVFHVDDLSINPRTQPPPSVDGRSLTLAALLALASHHYACPLPNDVVASADIGPSGSLLPVGGVREKVTTLRYLLPGLRVLVVAQAQAEEWTNALQEQGWTDVAVAGYSSAADAIGAQLNPAARLHTLSEAQVDRQIAHLRQLVLIVGMAAPVNWGAVASFVAALTGADGPKLPDRGGDLSLIRLVAARYARLDLLPADPALCEAAVAEPSPRLRALKLSQLIQQHADLATDLPPALAATNPAAYTGVFGHRVRGAWCRWLLAFGTSPIEERAKIALAGHRAIVEDLLRDEDYGELSHSVAALLYLAGALEDDEAYRYALGVADALAHSPDMAPADLAFIRLARARAAIWAPGADRAAAAADLEALRTDITTARAHSPLARLQFFEKMILDLLPALRSTEHPPTLTAPDALDTAIRAHPSTRQPYANAIAGQGDPTVRARRFDRFFTG